MEIMWTETLERRDSGTENQGSYTVQKWDTLSKIAQEKKIPLRDLIATQWSNFDPNKLRIGQVLNMPEKHIDTTWVEQWAKTASVVNEQAIMNALAEQEKAQAEMEEALNGVFGGTSESLATTNTWIPVWSTDIRWWEYLISAGDKFNEKQKRALEDRWFTQEIIASIQQAGYTIDTSAIDALDVRSWTDAISKTPFYIRWDRSGKIDISYIITRKLTWLENNGTQLLLTFDGDSSPKITLPIKSKQ